MSAEPSWDGVLDELEHLHTAYDPAGVSAEQLLVLTRWAPPAGLGPLPPSLAGRARLVLRRQAELAEELGLAAAAARRHTRAVASVPAAVGHRPAYLDVTG